MAVLLLGRQSGTARRAWCWRWGWRLAVGTWRLSVSSTSSTVRKSKGEGGGESGRVGDGASAVAIYRRVLRGVHTAAANGGGGRREKGARRTQRSESITARAADKEEVEVVLTDRSSKGWASIQEADCQRICVGGWCTETTDRGGSSRSTAHERARESNNSSSRGEEAEREERRPQRRLEWVVVWWRKLRWTRATSPPSRWHALFACLAFALAQP